MNRRFLMQVLLWALLYYLVVLALDGVIFLLSHVPPKVFNLDGLLLALGRIEQFLVWPRVVLRRLWPGENTPLIVNNLLTVVNCLVWGFLLAGVRVVWGNMRR